MTVLGWQYGGQGAGETRDVSVGVTVGCCGGHRLMELVLGDVVLVGARMVSRSLGCGVNCDGHTVNEGHS